MEGRQETIRAMTRAALRALRDARALHMIVGAVAAGVWGTPRFTADADFVVGVPPKAIGAVLAAFARRGFHVTPGLAVLWSEHGSVRLPFRRDPVLFHIDLLAAASAFDRAALRRARRRTLFGLPVRVATAEDVILYKLAAARPQDRLDIGNIVARQGRRLHLPYLRRWARRLAADYPAWARLPTELRAAIRPLEG